MFDLQPLRMSQVFGSPMTEVSTLDIWCMPITGLSVFLGILAISWICSAVELMSTSRHATCRTEVNSTDGFVYPKCLLLQLRGVERTVCPNLPHCLKLGSFSFTAVKSHKELGENGKPKARNHFVPSWVSRAPKRQVDPVLSLHGIQGQVNIPSHLDETWSKRRFVRLGPHLTIEERDERSTLHCTVHHGQIPIRSY